MKIGMQIEFNGEKHIFYKDYDDEFFPSEEGRAFIGDAAFDQIIRDEVVNDFYSNFNITIWDEKGREI